MERSPDKIQDDIEWYENAYYGAPDDAARRTIDIKLEHLAEELKRATAR
jgi:hypothetical protein